MAEHPNSVEPGEESSPGRPARRMWRWYVVLTVIALGAAGAVTAWTCCPNSGPPPEPSAELKGDALLRKMVLGVWQDEYKGKRTMTLLEDGTGTMHVELSGFNAILGSHMRFDMEWSIEEGRLKKRTIGGEPSGRVNLILKTMGDRVDEPILELTEQRLLLLDKDGETKYDWRRPDK